MQDNIGFINENPEIANINSGIYIKEGHKRSVNKGKIVYKVGYIGNILQVPEFIFHDFEFKLEMIICEKDRLNDDLLTFSLVRNIKLYPIVNTIEIEAIIEKNNDIDFFIMCSFGKKITRNILTQVDIYNIHHSRLPYYKGRNPTFWATIADEKEVGISIHKVVDGFDEGDIISQRTLPFYIWMTEKDLYYDLIKNIPELISDLKKYIKGLIKARKNENGYYYKPISETDYIIDLYNDTPTSIYNKVRSQKRYNGAKILLKNSILRVKEIRFTHSTNNLETGELFFNTEGCLCVHYKNQIAIKCLDYHIEEISCQ
jgi:methionyl-tRNA formyltransferase